MIGSLNSFQGCFRSLCMSITSYDKKFYQYSFVNLTKISFLCNLFFGFLRHQRFSAWHSLDVIRLILEKSSEFFQTVVYQTLPVVRIYQLFLQQKKLWDQKILFSVYPKKCIKLSFEVKAQLEPNQIKDFFIYLFFVYFDAPGDCNTLRVDPENHTRGTNFTGGHPRGRDFFRDLRIDLLLFVIHFYFYWKERKKISEIFTGVYKFFLSSNPLKKHCPVNFTMEPGWAFDFSVQFFGKVNVALLTIPRDFQQINLLMTTKKSKKIKIVER